MGGASRKPPAEAGGRGSHARGLSPGVASDHQPSTFTVTELTLLALGAVTVSSPSR
jgi:hypothetical protein